MSSTTPTAQHVDELAREWREAGQHLKAYGETLMRAFQSGWESEQAETEFARLAESFKATAKRLETALDNVRSTAEQENVRTEMTEARAKTAEAAEDTQRVLGATLGRFSEEMAALVKRIQARGASAGEDRAS